MTVAPVCSSPEPKPFSTFAYGVPAPPAVVMVIAPSAPTLMPPLDWMARTYIAGLRPAR
ncbi:hypothetical protein GCM10009625_23580 [Brachybacterium fresconis]